MGGIIGRLGGGVLDVAVAGGMIRAEILGDGPALFLLHGWTLDRRIWAPQRALASRFRLIAIDRRSFGQSTAPANLALEPDDVLAVADALGAERFGLVGMSQGGRVALRLAGKAPERVAQVLLLGSALDGVTGQEADPPVPLAAMAEAARSGDRQALHHAWRSHPFMAARHTEHRALLDAILADYDGRDLLAPPSPLPVTAADLATLPMPVMALAGEADSARRRTIAESIANTAPHGRFRIVANAGHLVNLDAPEAVAAALS